MGEGRKWRQASALSECIAGENVYLMPHHLTGPAIPNTENKRRPQRVLKIRGGVLPAKMEAYTLPPRTTKRTTPNLKTKNNQNCEKIELYGSLITKELKKKLRNIHLDW